MKDLLERQKAFATEYERLCQKHNVVVRAQPFLKPQMDGTFTFGAGTVISELTPMDSFAISMPEENAQ